MPSPNNAMAFIIYYLKAEVSASQTNELGYPTANKASVALVTPEVAQNTAVFPDEANLALLVPPEALGNATRESMTAVFTSFKKGK